MAKTQTNQDIEDTQEGFERFYNTPHDGKRITKVLAFYDIKQTDLAERMGVSQQYISKLLGKENIEVENILRIAKASEIDPKLLLKNKDSNIIIQYNHDNSKGVVEEEFNQTINHPLDKVEELYERIIKEKIEAITVQKAELTNLRKQVEKKNREINTLQNTVSELEHKLKKLEQ